MDIWDIARMKLADDSVKSDLEEDSTLLFVGNQKSGKTSMVYRFLNREENPRPTLALEYTFGRQSKANDGVNKTKNVCHMWELGGGTLFTDLLEIPINLKTLLKLSVVVVVDLTAPQELLVTLTTLLDAVRSRIERCFVHKPNLKDKLLKRFWKKFPADHSDKDAINPMFVPVVIIGGKYDVFQNFEPEQRRVVCQTLRMVAHTNGAALVFFSSRIESLVNRTRAVISHLAFDTQISPSTSFDHSKPLFVSCGSDSLVHIGGDKVLAMWKTDYETHFPQVSKAFIMPEDPAKDVNFREPEIDDLRQQKDDELEAYKKQLLMNS